jgi:hypothetical protein
LLLLLLLQALSFVSQLTSLCIRACPKVTNHGLLALGRITQLRHVSRLCHAGSVRHSVFEHQGLRIVGSAGQIWRLHTCAQRGKRRLGAVRCRAACSPVSLIGRII